MISLNDVTFSYDPPFAEPQIQNVTLEVPTGQHVALLGRNGSGKSTLARLLNGLIVPQSGSVTVDGHSTSDPGSLRHVRAAVGLVFQNPQNQQVGTTVFEDIAFGLANHGVPTDQMPHLARKALDLVGLDFALDRKITSLSGGQLQRHALASVIALEPRYIVLDEATSMLDPASREQLLATLQTVKERVGLGIVQISHYLNEIENADRALVIIDGKIACDTTPDALLGDTGLLERAGLEQPRASRSLVDLARSTPPPVTVSATAADQDVVLELRGAMFSYGREHRRSRGTEPNFTLDETDLRLYAGELVAISGPSGAGKTTLLNLIKGASKPTRGTIEILGNDPWQRKNRGLFDGIGYVLQHPEHQLFATTVRDDIAFGLRGQKLEPARVEAKVDERAGALGIPTHALDVSPFSLSGGQQRRVAMAGVFINEPAIILLDEPTAGLDAPSRDLLFEVIHRERARGATVVWVSHRLEEIAGHASRIVVVEDGLVVADASPEDVFGDVHLGERLGWMPRTSKLGGRKTTWEQPPGQTSPQSHSERDHVNTWRPDPRIMLVISFLLSVGVVATPGLEAKSTYAIAAAIMWTILRLGFRRFLLVLVPLIPFVFMTIVLRVIIQADHYADATLVGSIPFSFSGLLVAGAFSVQVFTVILALGLSVFSNPPLALSEAAELILRPLSRLKIPVHEGALMFSIALRFLPIMTLEFLRLTSAQATRGSALTKRGALSRLRAVGPLVIPLFVVTLIRARELSEAIESRGYFGATGRTLTRRYRCAPRDHLLILLSFFAVTVATLLAVRDALGVG